MANTKLEHERMRWKTMNRDELTRRLYKLTDAEKLQHFYDLAIEHNDTHLATIALMRIEEHYRQDERHSRRYTLDAPAHARIRKRKGLYLSCRMKGLI